MQRRDFIKRATFGLASVTSAAVLGAESTVPALTPQAPGRAPDNSCRNVGPTVMTDNGPVPLALVRAQPDRIISLTVCTRPFRAQGPRIEPERLGRKTVVHNYGHGGSGWSLSWGSSTLALRHVLETREREIAVIGCGVLGLTSALLAQRAGLKVRIYAKERPPDVLSAFATGNWSPNSRFCTQEAVTPELEQRWEEMARISFRTYQHLLGLPGEPIEWRDGYRLWDGPLASGAGHGADGAEPVYPNLERPIRDITPRSQFLEPGTHPFPVANVIRYTNMIFNISAYSRMLVSDFIAAGGTIETRTFEKPGDISRLREKTVMNCTGYGARALFGDESIIPVRGQLMRLIPQPEITYGLTYDGHFYMLPRRDGIVLQAPTPGDFGNADTTPDRAAAERTVMDVAHLNERIRAGLACTP
jgi:glycine/D-amino acid oxidase-like deaminating enzyme